MIRAIIVDDEAHAIRSLEAQLLKLGGVDVLATSKDVEGAKLSLRAHKPDLLFLDVELSDNTGFELLENIANQEFDVIFTTAFEQYALQAIKASALDYLIKPVKQEHLEAAVQKHLKRRRNNPVVKQVEVLFEHYNKSPAVRNLALPTQDGIEFISIDDIIRLESTKNYTCFYLTNTRKLTISRTLKEYEQVLSQSGFYRIHNCHIINFKYLDKYFRGDGGYVRMKDGSTAEVSRQRKDDFLKMLGR